MLSEANSERLTLVLCRMRGAALKFGQLLSIQDEHVGPGSARLRRGCRACVRARACKCVCLLA